jgi:PKD repeat protein
MIDWVVLLTPVALLAVFSLLAFVGCAQILGIEEGVPRPPEENHPPTAVIADPVIAGLQVQLSGSGSSDPDSDPLSFNWAFGDNVTSTQSNPTHAYAAAGTYTVQLTVSDGALSDTATRSVTVASPAADAVLRLPGTDGNAATTPSAAALDLTGDLDLRVRLAATDWTPSDISHLIAKGMAYEFRLNTNGRLSIRWSDGMTRTEVSTEPVALQNGVPAWVRVTLDVDNGGVYEVRFHTSVDGTNWTELGMPITGALATSVVIDPGPLAIGARSNGNLAVAGDVYRAQVYDGIQEQNGTLVFDFDPAVADIGQTQLTDNVNGAPVTITQTGPTPAEIVAAP